MSLAGDRDRHTEIEELLSQCENFSGHLTDWESQFIESIREQFDSRGDLSDKQVEILERIYCKLP